MYDVNIVKEILEQILNSISIVNKRFACMESVSDFTDSDYGTEKLDSICMQLIAIGESLKKLIAFLIGHYYHYSLKLIGKV